MTDLTGDVLREVARLQRDKTLFEVRKAVESVETRNDYSGDQEHFKRRALAAISKLEADDGTK